MPETHQPPEPLQSQAEEVLTKGGLTFLGRLSKAIKEQNWFAVGLEVTIVVVGVVLGFQISAWGQAQADRAKEEQYLFQLIQDIKATESHIDEVNEWLLVSEIHSGALQRAFLSTERPSPDSLHNLILRSSGFWKLNAITGTADALVATGDLALIRSDSIRTAVTSYLRTVDYEEELQSVVLEALTEQTDELVGLLDPIATWELLLDFWDIDSTSDPLYPFPEDMLRPSSDVDVDDVLSDDGLLRASGAIVSHRLILRASRDRLMNSSLSLRRMIESEISS